MRQRVTVEAVRTAYEETGLEPRARCWAELAPDGKRCGCPLSALAIASDVATFDALRPSDHNNEAGYDSSADPDYPRNWLPDALDLPGGYVLGFTYAIDCPKRAQVILTDPAEAYGWATLSVDDDGNVIDGGRVPAPLSHSERVGLVDGLRVARALWPKEGRRAG